LITIYLTNHFLKKNATNFNYDYQKNAHYFTSTIALFHLISYLSKPSLETLFQIEI